MKGTLACSALLVTLVVLGAPGCGGGPSEAPKGPTATTAPAAPPPAPAAGGPTTTVAGQGEEAAPLLAWADGFPVELLTSVPTARHVLELQAQGARCVSLLPDGAPHSVPVWIAVENGQLAFLTSPRSQKAR